MYVGYSNTITVRSRPIHLEMILTDNYYEQIYLNISENRKMSYFPQFRHNVNVFFYKSLQVWGFKSSSRDF